VVLGVCKAWAIRQARPVTMRVVERILTMVREVGDRELGKGDLGFEGDTMYIKTGGYNARSP